MIITNPYTGVQLDTTQFENFTLLTRDELIALTQEQLFALYSKLSRALCFLQDYPIPSDRPLFKDLDASAIEVCRLEVLILPEFQKVDDIHYSRNLKAKLQLEIDDLNQLKDLNDSMQSKCVMGVRRWHFHETIDDVIHARHSRVESEMEKLDV